MRKNNKNDQHFEGYSLSMHLAYQCYYLDCQNNGGHSNSNIIRKDTLATYLAEKTTIVAEHLTLTSYLKIMATITKMFFFHKKPDNKYPVIRGMLFVQ